MSEKGLAEQLDITEKEAMQYIEGYFNTYPGVKSWMAYQKKLIQTYGYTTTMLGRKRRVHAEIESMEFWRVQSAIRMGINAIIQGSNGSLMQRCVS